jgi:hypothetical protein
MSSAEDMRVAASNDTGRVHDASSVPDYQEVVEDYIVEIPELEGLLPFESRDLGEMEFSVRCHWLLSLYVTAWATYDAAYRRCTLRAR